MMRSTWKGILGGCTIDLLWISVRIGRRLCVAAVLGPNRPKQASLPTNLTRTHRANDSCRYLVPLVSWYGDTPNLFDIYLIIAIRRFRFSFVYLHYGNIVVHRVSQLHFATSCRYILSVSYCCCRFYRVICIQTWNLYYLLNPYCVVMYSCLFWNKLYLLKNTILERKWITDHWRFSILYFLFAGKGIQWCGIKPCGLKLTLCKFSVVMWVCAAWLYFLHISVTIKVIAFYEPLNVAVGSDFHFEYSSQQPICNGAPFLTI